MPASSIFNWFSRPNSKSTLDGRGPNSLSEEPEPYNRLTPFEVGSLLTSLAEAQKRKESLVGHELGGLSATARPCSPRRCRQDGSSCSGSSSSCSKDIGPSTSSTAPALPTASSCRQEAAALAGCAAVSEQQGSPCPNKQLADDCSPQAPQPSWYRGSDLRRHQVVRFLGGGANGIVSLAEAALADGSSLQMAVKTIWRKEAAMLGEEQDAGHLLDTARREVEGMRAMQGCPHALQLYGSSFDSVSDADLGSPPPAYQLYMELAEKGTLTNELEAAVRANPRTKAGKRQGPLMPMTRVAEAAHALLSALDHMNSRNYAHCDVKPDNVFVMADGSFRLGDPGVACTADASGVLEHAAGTPGYCSPEMVASLRGHACRYPITFKADMFSVAQVLALCCCWYDDQVAWHEYLRWEKDLPECVPAGLKELIAAMVEADPAKRPSAREALGHPWLVEAMQQAEQQRQQEAQQPGGVDS